jgi:hypothetical protein
LKPIATCTFLVGGAGRSFLSLMYTGRHQRYNLYMLAVGQFVLTKVNMTQLRSIRSNCHRKVVGLPTTNPPKIVKEKRKCSDLNWHNLGMCPLPSQEKMPYYICSISNLFYLYFVDVKSI